MEYLLKVSALLTVFYVVYQFLLQKETFFEVNRVFLLVGLVVSFLLPLWTIPVYHEYVPQTFPVESYQEFTEVTVPATTPVMIEESFDIKDYLPYIYGFGIIGFLSFFVFRLISLLRACIKTKSYPEEKFAMIETSHDVSPFSFFKWIVFNPNQFPKEELEQIVAHEKVHAKQYHSVDILVAELCCVLVWFHPLVWLYNKSLKQNLEFLADKYAVNQLKNRKSYQYTLLKASVHSDTMALSNQFYNSLIKKRIAMLQKTKSKKINLLKYLLVLPALGFFLMGFNTKDVFVEKKANQVRKVIDKSTSDEELKEYKELFKEEYGVGFICKKLKRNSDSEIISIEVELTRQTGKITTRQLEGVPIKPFSIHYDPQKQEMKTFRLEKNKFIIHNYFSNKDLDFFISELNEQGFEFDLKDIKRNKHDLITSMDFDIIKDGVEGKYRVKGHNPVEAIYIEYIKEVFHINTLNFVEQEEKGYDKDVIWLRVDKNISIKYLESVKAKIEATSDVDFSFKVLKRDTENKITELEYEFKGDGQTQISRVDTSQSKFIVKFDPKTNLISKSIVNNNNGAITYGEIDMLSASYIERITKDYSDENLKSTRERLKKDGVIATFNNVKRNEFGEIISIDARVKSKFTGERMLAISIGLPIDNVLISYVGNGYDLKITSEERENKILYVLDGEEVSKDHYDKLIKERYLVSHNVLRGEKAIKKYGTKGNDWVVEAVTKDLTIAVDSIELIKKQREEKLKIRKALLQEKRAKLDRKQQKKNFKYIVDGQEIDEVEFKKINPSEIESINVFKEKALSEKYQKEGVESVLVVVKKEKEGEFKLLLTKNVSDEELAKHKERYKTKFGKELTYKVERNSKNEIILFEMIFLDSGSIKTDKKEGKELPIQPMLIKNNVDKKQLHFHHFEL